MGRKKKNRRGSLRNSIFSASSGTGRPGLKGPLLLLPRKKGRRSFSSPLWMLGPPTPRLPYTHFLLSTKKFIQKLHQFVLKKARTTRAARSAQTRKHPQTNRFHDHEYLLHRGKCFCGIENRLHFRSRAEIPPDPVFQWCVMPATVSAW